MLLKVSIGVGYGCSKYLIYINKIYNMYRYRDNLCHDVDIFAGFNDIKIFDTTEM